MLDENDLEESINNVEEIDYCITKIEKLRSKHRRIHKNLASLKDDYEIKYRKEFLEMTASIKCYIEAANKRKSLIQQSQKEADVEKKTTKQR